MGLLKKLLNRWRKDIEEPEADFGEWDDIIYERDELQVNDNKQRGEYVRGCLDQIAEAEKEVENLQFEYNMVTSYLKDMEEIEALPEEEKEEVRKCARKLDKLEQQQEGYTKRKKRMSDEKYREMERMEEEVQEGYDKLTETEEKQDLIKRDLRRLDGERQAYLYRKRDLQYLIADTRSMTIVCAVAVVVCILILFVMQYYFHMNVQLGYFFVAAAGAVAITIIFLKHNDAIKELSRVEKGIGRIIKLHNAAKIRYVNNTRLLDYLCLKYNVSGAEELGKNWQLYQEEKEERINTQQTERDLDQCQKELLHVLRRYQVKDPIVWLHQTAALLDKREMVEIRHNLIIRRQSLRRRMDYNKEVMAGKAQAEIKDLVENYPRYAQEILDMVGEYERNFS